MPLVREPRPSLLPDGLGGYDARHAEGGEGVRDDGDDLAADDVDSPGRARQPAVLDVLGDGRHCT